MHYEIIPLSKEKWKGIVVPIRYTTDAYFDLELTESEAAFTARMVKKNFDAPVTHTPEEYNDPDRLYQDYWEKAEAYGIVGKDGTLLACIEICPEEWSNLEKDHIQFGAAKVYNKTMMIREELRCQSWPALWCRTRP